MYKKSFNMLLNYRNLAFSLDNKSAKKNTEDRRTPVLLFGLTLAFYVLHQLVMQPGWVLGGEMWAEMGTNYFPNAGSPSYFQRFFATDAGYIPVPQRLIAFAGNILSFPAASIPYFYTWSSLILTAMLVGAFCLSAFRVVVRNDLLRFAAAIAVLIVADFATRTFINFTYFVVFFAAIVTALALVDDADDVPVWAWFLPVLMVSKPYSLVALPAMILAALASKTRFRWIAITTLILCLGQVVQIVISQGSGVMASAQSHEITLVSKLVATAKYFFGFLGGYLIGPDAFAKIYSQKPGYAIWIGIFIFAALAYGLIKIRARANALIIIGLSLLFFNVLLNCFALSASWNTDMARLSGLPLYRHIISGFMGCVLILIGLIANLTEGENSNRQKPYYKTIGVAFFALWFFFSGWLVYGARLGKEPVSPTLNNSQWQNLAAAIDSAEPTLCVPIDPFVWIYGRNCSLLNPEIIGQAHHFERAKPLDGEFVLETASPPSVKQHSLVSLGVLVKPSGTVDRQVSARAVIYATDGTLHSLTGERKLSMSGGLLLLTGQPGSPIKDIASVKFIFNVPVEVAFTANTPTSTPAILWMGF